MTFLLNSECTNKGSNTRGKKKKTQWKYYVVNPYKKWGKTQCPWETVLLWHICLYTFNSLFQLVVASNRYSSFPLSKIIRCFFPLSVSKFLYEKKQLKPLIPPNSVHLRLVRPSWTIVFIKWLLVILQQHQHKTIPHQKPGSTWLTRLAKVLK